MDEFDNTPLIRTDFGDEAAWLSLVRSAAAPSPEGFEAMLRIVDERKFEGCSPEALFTVDNGWNDASIIFVADSRALADADQPVLCVDLIEEPGRSFRCIASELWGPENNLRLANMFFSEFAENVGEDGVFRGFA